MSCLEASSRLDTVRRRYLSNAGNAAMTVLHDKGPYRHLRFVSSNPFYWFDIITWPKGLTINGGMGSYTLKVDEDDLLALFLRSSSPSYWQEKVVGTERNDGHYGWLDEVFAEYVNNAVDTWAADLDEDDAVLLRDRVDTNVLAYRHEMSGALLAVRDFEFDGRRFEGWSEWDCEGITDRFMFNCFALADAARVYAAHKAAGQEVA